MPIYMDRHDVSKEVTAESVAQLHQEDLKIQHQYNCRGLTYWFDDHRKTAFCLVEAPNAEAVHKMHKHAHGEVPHTIIEVDAAVIESFLGRIKDPDAAPGTELNIINEPAFRFLLSVRTQIKQLDALHDQSLASTLSDYLQQIIEVVNEMQGTLVRKEGDILLTSFTTVEQAVACGTALCEDLGSAYVHLGLSVGLDAGLPVEGNKSIFEDTIQTSKRLCDMGRGLSVSPIVMQLYQDASLDSNFHPAVFNKISGAEMIYFHKLFDFLEVHFSNAELSIDAFASALGYSRSQAYRNNVGLTGYSPNAYLNQYRLERSLEKLNSGMTTVSETAFLCGFSSASYFSKCFRSRFGVSPKAYLSAIRA